MAKALLDRMEMLPADRVTASHLNASSAKEGICYRHVLTKYSLQHGIHRDRQKVRGLVAP